MIRELEMIAEDEKRRGSTTMFTRNMIKEYLQVYLLSFIYTSSKYNKNLIFTGSTCLRHFYDLERLSEDIDFDYLKTVDSEDMANDICKFFKDKYSYKKLSVSLKQKGNQILVKFPVLHNLRLAGGNESDLLYVKLDLSEVPSDNYEVLTTSSSKYGFNYIAKHYDLASLMAGKLHAVITRRHLKGRENSEGVKGRDYYDLLWFLKKSVSPNLKRLSDMLGREVTIDEVERDVDEKVHYFIKKHMGDFQSDMVPLLRNAAAVKYYVKNYEEEYKRFKNESFIPPTKQALVR